jgi:glycosidase
MLLLISKSLRCSCFPSDQTKGDKILPHVSERHILTNSSIVWATLDVETAWITVFLHRSTRYIHLASMTYCMLIMSQQSFYHPFCLIDYSNATSIQQCWEGDNIVALPDLRTEDSDVLDVWKDWVTNLVSTYEIDGLRIDSAQQVDQAFFPPFETAGMSSVPLCLSQD